MRQPSTDFLYFNPRLREGGDSNLLLTHHLMYKFQSTPPRRRRLSGVSMAYCSSMISIHASEKEATSYHYHRFGCFRFQSTPPRRRRQTDRGNGQRIRQFQSTPPRRRRLQHIVIPQLSCTYLVSTTFLSAIFSFISQYIVLFFLF